MLRPVLSGCNGVRVGYPVKHSNLFYVESNLKQVDNVIYKILDSTIIFASHCSE